VKAARCPVAITQMQIASLEWTRWDQHDHTFNRPLRDFSILVPVSRHCASLRAGLTTIAPPFVPQGEPALPAREDIRWELSDATVIFAAPPISSH